MAELIPRGQPATEALVTDADLARRAVAGDHGAFEQIIRRFNPRLYRFARALTGDDHEAREVVQESYVRAYFNLASFRGPAGFSTWLHVIVRNEALAQWRRKGREMTTDEESLERLLTDAGGGPEPGPDTALENERLAGALEEAIDRLPDAFRVVFVLRAVEGWSVHDAARILDLKEQTVKTRLHRARRLLRARLQQQFESVGTQVYEFAGSRCDELTAAVMRRLNALDASSRHGR